MSVCIYINAYIYIYIHISSPPPPILFFPPNDLFHYSFTIKKAIHIHNYGQDLINHISPLMGGTPLRESSM